MPKKQDRSAGKPKAKKNITLRDVVIHMEHMEQRLSGKIEVVAQKTDENTRRIEENTSAITKNSKDIQDLQRSVDALDEDLRATMRDTLLIRRHVGMTHGEDA